MQYNEDFRKYGNKEAKDETVPKTWLYLFCYMDLKLKLRQETKVTGWVKIKKFQSQKYELNYQTKGEIKTHKIML
jgi:hypothetical protein